MKKFEILSGIVLKFWIFEDSIICYSVKLPSILHVTPNISYVSQNHFTKIKKKNFIFFIVFHSLRKIYLSMSSLKFGQHSVYRYVQCGVLVRVSLSGRSISLQPNEENEIISHNKYLFLALSSSLSMPLIQQSILTR